MSEESVRITRRMLKELVDKRNLDTANELIDREFVKHEYNPQAMRLSSG